jgi:hypothetical protein
VITASGPLTLDSIYRVPNPWDTAEQHERYEHADIPRRTRAELMREHERLRLRLLLDDAADVWMLQRLEKPAGIVGSAHAP